MIPWVGGCLDYNLLEPCSLGTVIETEVLRKLTKLIQPLLLCEDYSSVQTGKTLVLSQRPLCPLLLLRGREWDSELKLRPKLKSETSWSLIASCF